MIVYLTGNRKKEQIFALATSLWGRGIAVYAPKLNCADFNLVQIKQSEVDSLNLEIVDKCDAVITTRDYFNNTGHFLEHNRAEALRIPVFYSIEDFDFKYGKS